MWIQLLCSTAIIALSSASVAVDNAILGEPEVQCGSDSISLLFHTKRPFLGKIFVKGHVADPACITMGDRREDHRFTIKFDECGVRRQREVNGVVIVSTVIVSFHSIFITQVDRAYRLSCFYVEASKTVNQQMDVSMLTTQEVTAQTAIPVCRYEILSNGPNGQPIQYARIGDTVYHKWTCVSELTDVYCMRVHSCTVYDGQGGTPVNVLDANGCQVDGVVLQNLDYLSDLSAGQEAHVFKFADRAGLYFNCQIQLTIRDRQYGCAVSQPDCSPEYQVPATDRTTEISSASVEDFTVPEDHESGYPTRGRPVYPVAEPTTPSYDSGSGDVSGSGEMLSGSGEATTIKTTTKKPATTHAPRTKKPTGPPGTQPTYQDMYKPKNTTTTPIPEAKFPTVYNRLIRRDVRKASSLPDNVVHVADFDLPERGLIVFGLEDAGDHDGAHKEGGAARLIVEDRTQQTCFTTNKLLTLTFLLLVFVGGVMVAMGAIVVRQRKLLSQAFLK